MNLFFFEQFLLSFEGCKKMEGKSNVEHYVNGLEERIHFSKLFRRIKFYQTNTSKEKQVINRRSEKCGEKRTNRNQKDQ
jgi:hypothetical protein